MPDLSSWKVNTMTSRERIRKALNHEQPDRVPIDLGSTAVTGISASALARLRKALKLEDKPIKVHEPFQILGYVEYDVMKALNIDIVGLWTPYTIFGYRNEGWKPWKLFDGTDVLVGKGFVLTEDEKGDFLRRQNQQTEETEKHQCSSQELVDKEPRWKETEEGEEEQQQQQQEQHLENQL